MNDFGTFEWPSFQWSEETIRGIEDKYTTFKEEIRAEEWRNYDKGQVIEDICRILIHFKVAFRREATCKNPKRLYRYDYYLPEYKLLLEFDGPAHYDWTFYKRPNEYRGITPPSEDECKVLLENTKANDRAKELYAKELGLSLCRITKQDNSELKEIIYNIIRVMEMKHNEHKSLDEIKKELDPKFDISRYFKVLEN